MKKLLFGLIMTGLAGLAVCAGAAGELETFDYADRAALNRVWRGYGGGNPLPDATPGVDGTEKVMLLTTAGGPNDKVIFRDFEAEPGRELRLRIKASADTPAGTFAYLAIREVANATNLVITDFSFTPGKWQEIVIPNAGRFTFTGWFRLLICLHDAGKPLSVSIGAISMTPSQSNENASFQDTPELKQKRVKQLLTARTVQIDTGMAYYRGRSTESIAAEIRVNGFDGVYYYVMDDRSVVPGLIAELQRQNLAVALMTLPNLVYWSESQLADRLPGDYRNYLMHFTGPDMDKYRFIGFVYPEYNAWYKNLLTGILRRHNFDGFTFAEIMYPIYNGPERTPPFYGDVSPGFQQAFKTATGRAAFPNFTDPADPNYFKTNTELYRDLVEYRIRTINDFYDDIVNGPGGAREVAPNIAFATWTLGINIPGGVEKLREWEGNDIAAMIRQVKPDLHFIQTHAPDWCNPALPADYPRLYQPFFDAIRAADPEVRIAMQTDIGSLPAMRRSPAWVETFYQACRDAGVDSTTYYEFSLRDAVYASPPTLREIRLKGQSLQLIFDQRLGRESADRMIGRQLTSGPDRFTVRAAKADGNLLNLTLDLLPRPGRQLAVPVGGLADDPAVRLKLSHLPPHPRGPVNAVPADTVVTLPVLPPIDTR